MQMFLCRFVLHLTEQSLDEFLKLLFLGEGTSVMYIIT